MPTRRKFRRNNRNKNKSRRKRQRGGDACMKGKGDDQCNCPYEWKENNDKNKKACGDARNAGKDAFFKFFLKTKDIYTVKDKEIIENKTASGDEGWYQVKTWAKTYKGNETTKKQLQKIYNEKTTALNLIKLNFDKLNKTKHFKIENWDDFKNELLFEKKDGPLHKFFSDRNGGIFQKKEEEAININPNTQGKNLKNFKMEITLNDLKDYNGKDLDDFFNKIIDKNKEKIKNIQLSLDKEKLKLMTLEKLNDSLDNRKLYLTSGKSWDATWNEEINTFAANVYKGEGKGKDRVYNKDEAESAKKKGFGYNKLWEKIQTKFVPSIENTTAQTLWDKWKIDKISKNKDDINKIKKSIKQFKDIMIIFEYIFLSNKTFNELRLKGKNEHNDFNFYLREYDLTNNHLTSVIKELNRDDETGKEAHSGLENYIDDILNIVEDWVNEWPDGKKTEKEHYKTQFKNIHESGNVTIADNEKEPNFAGNHKIWNTTVKDTATQQKVSSEDLKASIGFQLIRFFRKIVQAPQKKFIWCNPEDVMKLGKSIDKSKLSQNSTTDVAENCLDKIKGGRKTRRRRRRRKRKKTRRRRRRRR